VSTVDTLPESSNSFRTNERVEIGKAIEIVLGERRGKDNPANCPEYKGKGLTGKILPVRMKQRGYAKYCGS